jgi:hypothetical protein
MARRQTTFQFENRAVARSCEDRAEETLRYISEMSGQMAAMAGAARLPMLTYFLNMARVEAEMQITELAPPPPRLQDV